MNRDNLVGLYRVLKLLIKVRNKICIGFTSPLAYTQMFLLRS